MAIQVEVTFKAPGPHPNGLQATEDGLWILDQDTKKADLVSYDGQLIRSLDTETDKGSGITVAGSHLWIASTCSHEIVKCDRST